MTSRKSFPSSEPQFPHLYNRQGDLGGLSLPGGRAACTQSNVNVRNAPYLDHESWVGMGSQTENF